MKKRSETYFENRSIIKLQYSDLNALSSVENKYLLQRIESQIGNQKNEISFTVNENNVKAIKEFLKNNIAIKIKYVDETASQTLEYSYFYNKFWSNEYEIKSINSYLKNGLATYLLLLTKQVDIKEEKENVVWIEKKRRLRLLSICSILNYHWTASHQNTKTILLLNIFHFLGNYEDLQTFKNNLENYIDKLNLNSFVADKSFFEVIDLYERYLLWLKQYLIDPIELKNLLSRSSENLIIFSKTFGFAKVVNFYNDKTVNLETPLGKYNSNKDVYGFVNEFIGSSPVFF